MRQAILILAALTALTSLAPAAPVCVNGNTLQSYITNNATLANACQVGDKVFWGFAYSSSVSGGGVAPTASQITITGDPSNPGEPGLIFASGLWVVSGSASFATNLLVDSSINFNVATASGLPLIADASLSFAGHTSFTGFGVAGIGESVTPNGQSSFGLTVDTSAGLFADVHQFFPPVSSLAVSKDLFVIVPASGSATPNTGSAQITQFREGFSVSGVPEPADALLIGSGLLALGLFRRRLST